MPHNAPPVYELKASLFRVLGHPARVRILELLRDGERSVGALLFRVGLIVTRLPLAFVWPRRQARATPKRLLFCREPPGRFRECASSTATRAARHDRPS